MTAHGGGCSARQETRWSSSKRCNRLVIWFQVTRLVRLKAKRGVGATAIRGNVGPTGWLRGDHAQATAKLDADESLQTVEAKSRHPRSCCCRGMARIVLRTSRVSGPARGVNYVEGECSRTRSPFRSQCIFLPSR
jgi:hypothetical protein